ncbi:MAG: lipoate--protein ligase family protein, partial [Halobacteriaceae archaeon]
KEIARNHAFPPRERRVGGRAVPYTGETVAFMKVTPVSDFREGIQDRYDECLTDLQQTLWRLGVPVLRGEPADSFCPGSYSLSYNGKIAGLAQRVRTDVAIVGGLIIVSHQDEFCEILEAIYPKLDLTFDPTSVGSVAAAGGSTNWNRIQSTLEEKLSHNGEPTVIDLSKIL